MGYDLKLKENELYQEIELFVDDVKIGEAEVEVKGKMISRLCIYEPFQDKRYGTEVVRLLNEHYDCNCLWVKADNEKAIHVYEKNGYKKIKPTMYLLERKG